MQKCSFGKGIWSRSRKCEGAGSMLLSLQPARWPWTAGGSNCSLLSLFEKLAMFRFCKHSSSRGHFAPLAMASSRSLLRVRARSRSATHAQRAFKFER